MDQMANVNDAVELYTNPNPNMNTEPDQNVYGDSDNDDRMSIDYVKHETDDESNHSTGTESICSVEKLFTQVFNMFHFRKS